MGSWPEAGKPGTRVALALRRHRPEEKVKVRVALGEARKREALS
jgi:hypothetical protein